MSKHFAVRLSACLLIMGGAALGFAQVPASEQPSQPPKTEEQQKDQQKERQADRQKQRQEQQQTREQNRESREHAREQIRDTRQDARSDTRTSREDARTQNRDDRKDGRDARQDTRHAQQDARDKVQDTRSGARDDRRDARQDTRDDRRDTRVENRPELRQRVQSYFRGRTGQDLGLRFGDDQSGRLTISEVDRNGVANRLGFRLGDIIMSLNGQGVRNSEEFDRELGANRDRTNSFIIQRNGRQYSIQLPAPAADRSYSYEPNSSQSPRAYLGVTFDPNYREFAVIRDVKSDSPAEQSGLKTGDILTHVNGEEVRSLQHAIRALAMTPPGQEFNLEYDRPKHETVRLTLVERDHQESQSTFAAPNQKREEGKDRPNQQH